ncbi:hypothetical protein RDV78_10145 [Bacillota bacterium LX-D]|nr:hypothetical protein [Bacillota bacterium LX-D]
MTKKNGAVSRRTFTRTFKITYLITHPRNIGQQLQILNESDKLALVTAMFLLALVTAMFGNCKW